MAGERVAPATTDAGGPCTNWMLLAAPVTSVSAPIFAPDETPVDVPEYVMFPLARGVPFIGRTLIPDHVNVLNLVPLDCVLAVVTQTVMVVLVGVTVLDEPCPVVVFEVLICAS